MQKETLSIALWLPYETALVTFLLWIDSVCCPSLHSFTRSSLWCPPAELEYEWNSECDRQRRRRNMSFLLRTNFAQLRFTPIPPLFPPTSPPLLHLGSDDSIGSSFKRISITETVFSLSVQASSHISASLSCLLFHSVPLLFPGRGLLRFYVTSVCVGCKSTDRYCLFLGNQKRRAWSRNANSLGKKSLPFCWHWCHFRMQQTG